MRFSLSISLLRLIFLLIYILIFDFSPLFLTRRPVQRHPGDAPFLRHLLPSARPPLIHYVAHAPHASVHVRYNSAQDMLIARCAARIMQRPWIDARARARAYAHPLYHILGRDGFRADVICDTYSFIRRIKPKSYQ